MQAVDNRTRVRLHHGLVHRLAETHIGAKNAIVHILLGCVHTGDLIFRRNSAGWFSSLWLGHVLAHQLLKLVRLRIIRKQVLLRLSLLRMRRLLVEPSAVFIWVAFRLHWLDSG